MKVGIYAAICIGCAPFACGQMDAYTMQAKYGPPLNRETFTVRPGIEMVVDYGAFKQVCRIQLPSGTQVGGSAGVATKQQIDEILSEVVPPLVRGKELNHAAMTFGAVSFFATEYEHVTIGESTNGDIGKGITVTFKNEACREIPK